MALRCSSVVWSPFSPSAELIASARRSQSSTSCWPLSMGPPGDPPMSWAPPKVLSDLQDFLDRGPLDEFLDVLLELEAIRCGDRVQEVRELEQRVRHARVPDLVQASLLAHASGDRAKDGVGHAREISQGLVPVLAGAEVDLGHRIQPDHLEDVYHDPGLHRVAGEERDRGEELPVGDELPGEGLHEAGELGIEEVEEGLGRELRDPPTAVEFHGLVALEWASVGGL